MNNPELERLYELKQKIRSTGMNPEANIILLDGRGKNIPNGVTYEVGKEIAFTLKRLNQGYFLVSGDGRISTPQMIRELTEALTDNGITVLYAGYNNPTPMFEIERARLGISGANITASHQSFEYNGLKLVFERNANGKEAEEELRQGIKLRGTIKTYNVQPSLRKHYIETLSGKVRGTRTDNHKGLVLYDAMQGVSFPFFREIADEKKIRYEGFRTEPDGFFSLTDGGPDPSRVGNYRIIKEAIPDLTKYGIICLVDGDGDRFSAAISSGLIKPPVLVVMRALHLRPEKFIAEYCLASIIREYLQNKGIEVIGVKRGRPSLISKTKEHKAPGAEIGLHHYNDEGVDDGIENAFEMISLAEQENIGKRIKEIEDGIRRFIPEIRVATQQNSKAIAEMVAEKYASLSPSTKDGMILEKDDYALYIRGSSNENKITVNANATRQGTLDGIVEGAFAKLSEIEPGLGERLRKKLEEETTKNR